MAGAYMGRVLRVELDSGRIWEEQVPHEVYRRFLSGSGLGAWMLYHHMPPQADPLGPENMLGFVAGLLTGCGSLFTGRWMVVGKSPLTGGWGEANCGGTFAPAIKRCGYDGIFFTGISPTPVYLQVARGKAELRDASDLWGLDTTETERVLMQRARGRKAPRVACIGPAGERLSLIAGVSNDRGRMAARSGLGAVMGAKRLKALVLSGTRQTAPHDRAAMKRLSRRCNRWVQFQPPFIPGWMTPWLGALMRWLPVQLAQDGLLYKIMLRKWGTVSMNQTSVEMGDAPIRNWEGSCRDFGPRQSRAVDPDRFTDRETVKYHCYSCPLGCGGICSLPDKNGGGFEETHKPEYETVLALGGLCLNTDAESISRMNEMLNRAGMDSISAGGTIAFAIECFEKAILTTRETDGLELTWGNTPAIIALLEKMIRREGIGDLLADGSRRAAERLGLGAQRYAMHAGGQELGMHDGRNDPGFALHYAVEPAPGRHTTGSQLYYEMFQLWKKVSGVPRIGPLAKLTLKSSKYRPERAKAAKGVACSAYMNVLNGAGGCLFAALLGSRRFPLFDWLNAATGWQLAPEQYMQIGKSIQTLRQAFNIRHGIEPRRVTVPDRALGLPPQREGANRGRRVELEPMMQDYWEMLGWDPETGKPGEGLLTRLGLAEEVRP